jgi:hypothetical protein
MARINRAATLILALTAAGGAHAQSGKIRICRYPRLTELMDRHSVPIPAGTVFINSFDPRTGSDIKPVFELRTTADVVLPPKPGCVTAPAEFKEPAPGFALTTHYGPLPSQLNVAGLSIVGRVAADFK